MRHRAVAGAVVALLLTACGSTKAATSAPHPGPDILLTQRDFGRTILVHQGQGVRFDAPGWDICMSPSVLQPLIRQSSCGEHLFRATGIGSELITAVLPPPPVHCPYGQPCMEQAPRYGWFVVIGVPAGESFHLAVSQMDGGSLLLVAPGMRIIAAVAPGDLTNTGPTVLSTAPYRNGTLTLISAVRPGSSHLSGSQFSIDVLVRPAGAAYDRVLSEKDGGRAVTTRAGQVIEFALANSAGFRQWTGGITNLLRPIVDPAAQKLKNATGISYLVTSTGSESIGFADDPSCKSQSNCRLLTRTIEFEVVAGP